MKKKFKRSVAMLLAAGMLLSGFCSCEKENDDLKINNNVSFEDADLKSKYDILHEALKEDTQLDFDKLIFYTFDFANEPTIYFCTIKANKKGSSQNEYKYIKYQVDNKRECIPLLGSTHYTEQTYPFTEVQLTTLYNIVTKYDPVDITDHMLTDDFKATLDGHYEEFCK